MTSSTETSMWQADPLPNKRSDFVFLAVDVVGHSKLVASAKSNLRMTQVHQILTHVKEVVHQTIPDYRPTFEWDWAGDGGIFAFPANDPEDPTTEKVLDCAISIWRGIPSMNDSYILERNGREPVHLHITMGRGEAYYVVDPGLRRSHALNGIMKLKVPIRYTTILVSAEIIDDLPANRHAEFIRIPVGPEKEFVHAHVDTIDAALRHLGNEHARQGEMVESAHCSFRVAALNLSIGKQASAIQALQQCIQQMDAIPSGLRHRYYWHTLRGFYAAWLQFLTEGPQELFAHRWEDRRALLDLEESLGWFCSHARTGNLLVHMEFILEQLDLLAHRFVNDPSGLTSLETCLLLLRCGYSRRVENYAIRERLQRIEAEMNENHSRSVDGDCSLCTGVAASCLLLAGNEQRANELLYWLESLQSDNYVRNGNTDYEDTPQGAHALHYASTVLCAFADRGSRVRARDSVKDVMLEKEWSVPDSLPAHWMRYRNISEFEVCGYILPALVRYHLAGGVFKDEEKRRCSEALAGLAKALGKESAKVRTDETPERLYGARENVGSFALGLVPGVELSAESEKIVRHGLARFEYRARRPDAREATRRQTLDSNTDRTRKFLSGWLLQWEMILQAPNPDTLPEYARDLLKKFGLQRP